MGNVGVAPALALTPEKFWSLYRNEIQARGAWSVYQVDAYWTPVVLDAADAACQTFGFHTAREYLKLDLCAWTGTECDWDLRVAFENENDKTWEDELCKLSHVISDLRVLVAYQLSQRHRAEEALDQCLIRHRRRIVRDCNCKWLFIFGPHYKDRSGRWAAYTIDTSGKRVQLLEEYPFLGIHMKD